MFHTHRRNSSILFVATMARTKKQKPIVICPTCGISFNKISNTHARRCVVDMNKRKLEADGFARIQRGLPYLRRMGVEIRRWQTYPALEERRRYRNWAPKWAVRVIEILMTRFDHPSVRDWNKLRAQRKALMEDKRNALLRLDFKNPKLGFHKAISQVAKMLKGLSEEEALVFATTVTLEGSIDNKLESIGCRVRERVDKTTSPLK